MPEWFDSLKENEIFGNIYLWMAVVILLLIGLVVLLRGIIIWMIGG